MDLTRAIIIGLVSGAVVLALSLVGRRAPVDQQGWRHVKPGALHWTGIGLGLALCLLMSWIRLFVGSSRADGETQMTILTGLIIAFASLTIATALAVHALRRRDVRYRGQRLSFQGPDGRETREISRILAVRHTLWGQAVLSFDDGTILRLDPNASGAQDLLDRISEGQGR
jgi:hypothetical protein